ncbi:MAG: GntR family transcriptional regulator [Armatimonadota bacterium]|nr:GntR family transcriptional regulator [Armatimonadota bacterium]MDR7439474.1 GntR family transcriptional regulator [Armatimonadota bacterium]MDR7563149.1 GntR family transcriptional regulator [Armatimonadota bacterium]MDR7568878.1 GntR family transcriptional regulator [Armatimonadota bacterium]MDR7600934.1 GntR family transcriptional regulator [Armatimonadota bacterium]
MLARDAERLIRSETLPLERSGISAQIAEILANEIIQGRLAGGTRLREEALAAQFKTSRTPVREALRRLEREHLVEHIPRRGFVVATIHARAVAGIYLCRAWLHGLAARQAALVATEAEIEELEGLVHRMRQALEPPNVPELFRLNVVFHQRVAEIARNPMLEEILRGLGRPILRLRYMSISVPGRTEASVRAHEEIVAAFRAKDPIRVETLVRENILAAGEAILRHYFPEELSQDPALLDTYLATGYGRLGHLRSARSLGNYHGRKDRGSTDRRVRKTGEGRREP